MKKISTLAMIAALAFAAPALAQTPADTRNGRTSVDPQPTAVTHMDSKKDSHASKTEAKKEHHHHHAHKKHTDAAKTAAPAATTTGDKTGK